MGKEGTEDDVDGFPEIQLEDVRRDPADAASRRACFAGDGDSVGVQIASGERDGDVALAGPSLDASEAVAIAAGREAARAILPDLRQALERMTVRPRRDVFGQSAGRP